MQKIYRIKISGQVQGVGLRWAVREKLAELGLVNGHAENFADGGVKVVFTGEEAPAQKFIDWARQGPPGARVEAVEVEEEALFD